MFIYQPLQATLDQFVEFWSLRYAYIDEQLYINNIGQYLTEQRILDLFRWKNGTPLSNRKLASVNRNFIQRRQELIQLPPEENVTNFLNLFINGGAIWRIFWLHCWQPDRFPIYDQHVHRAMTFIQTGVAEEIPQYDPRKVEAYINRYLPFHSQFAAIDGRSVDKALWSFGKFLKEANFPVFVPD